MTSRTAILAAAIVWSCAPKPVGEGAPGASVSASEAAGVDPTDTCPARTGAPPTLPGVEGKHLDLDYWLGRHDAASLDATLLDVAGVDALVASHASEDREVGVRLSRRDLAARVDSADVAAEVEERLAWMRGRVDAGETVPDGGESGVTAFREALRPRPELDVRPELRVALEDVQVRCAPIEASLFSPERDLRIDRNNCSTVRAQEPVLALETRDAMTLVRAGYTTGWIPASTALSPPVPPDLREAVASGPRVEVTRPTTIGGVPFAAGQRLPVSVGDPDGSSREVVVATAGGVAAVAIADDDALVSTQRPLTRRALLTAAFRYLGTPYGWGGEKGGRDCSRFIMDVFESFGIPLPRYSGNQALAGSFHIDLVDVSAETERMLIIDAAAERGAVLLHLPGHIMLYLGRDDTGRPMAIHSFAEYLAPCDEPSSSGVETLFEVDRVTVTDLELGRGSSRGAFIERLTRVTVIGSSPGIELDALARRRPAAPIPQGLERRCDSEEGVALFLSPKTPNSQQPLRVIVTATNDVAPLQIVLEGADGTRHTPTLRRLGGPPYAFVAELEAPSAGRWLVNVGESGRVLRCAAFDVAARRPRAESGSGAVWTNRNAWDRDFENLYAAWVESLFDYPIDDDRTWTSLHELTQDSERNLLYDHLSVGEDARLTMQPDCADLPYMMRAYFAWRMGLPFSYRACSRGRAGRPPRCDGLSTNLTTRATADDVDAFHHFSRRNVRSGVHSGGGRTHPEDDNTDFYPVALRREALVPGTLYADPYGHLLIIAQWLPQGADRYGILVGADAQPDGTIGRRRFWRGSFLFSPDTTDAGAGFKAFRPLVVARGGELSSLSNAELADHPDFAPFSLEQYSVSIDGFYERMDTLINPRPLDPLAMMRALVDALEESASRRVNSVDNGEAWLRSRGFSTIDMPSGYSIFETSGPWEDFSTPSRDMRLLISIDTVRLFPQRVRATPDRYGILGDDQDVAQAVDRLEAALDAELAARSFGYTRSDGSPWTLTLRDVIERREAFEMAYNPNDCPEVRWAAADGSDERATCRRSAPNEQRARMASYRSWFADRQRPPR